MSFRDTSADNQLGTLHLNELNNVKVRFETLNGVNINNLAMFNDKQAGLKDILLEIKVNKVELFLSVEQGSGKNENNVLLITTPKMRQNARKQISQYHGKSLTIENLEQYETSVTKEEAVEMDY